MDEPYRPTVRTQADLQEVWIHLMGPWGFGRRSIWMICLDDDGRVIPAITEIAECDDEPDPDAAAGLAEILASLEELDHSGSFAFLLSRPGSIVISDNDVAWSRMLLDAGDRADVRLQMLHLATDAGVRPLPPDELVARRTA